MCIRDRVSTQSTGLLAKQLIRLVQDLSGNKLSTMEDTWDASDSEGKGSSNRSEEDGSSWSEEEKKTKRKRKPSRKPPRTRASKRQKTDKKMQEQNCAAIRKVAVDVIYLFYELSRANNSNTFNNNMLQNSVPMPGTEPLGDTQEFYSETEFDLIKPEDLTVPHDSSLTKSFSEE
eukprot:TRINITY_DN4386_c0_g1_i1.p1 TRINITY_DN4386_c0_g1~~TRINITY_DN4386_c0_g1_i1.p1  ORF type:complete len:175 (+),score=40.44 TRINITY_DN4386_c0_g1_i1:32-556(+)